MFKFNFGNEEECPQPTTNNVKSHQGTTGYTSREVEIPLGIVDLVNNMPRDKVIKIDYNCGLTFYCFSPNEIMNMLKEKPGNKDKSDTLKADSQFSDLVPGKYEGGLKTWDSTKDLVVYFMKHKIENLKNDLNGKTVLDLGCGSGILGIMCLLLGACVTFQDYNVEVLEALTLPNIFLNFDDSVREKIRLFSGDWASFYDLIQEKGKENTESMKFDYILTSETIYNPENYKKIISIIKGLLKPTGTAFISAKTHYFGVGGDIQDFDNLLQQEGLNSRLCWETATSWITNEGVSRGILEVTL